MNNPDTAMPKATIANVPKELRDCPQWVLWSLDDRGGAKPTKVPRQITGFQASSTNPDTWETFEHVVTAMQAGPKFNGVGFVITIPYTGVDLDGCRDPKTGDIEPWAQRIIERLDSYTELSPSGAGVHIWARGRLPAGSRRKGRVEMYDDARYFTVTGAWLAETPPTIEDRQTVLEALHAELFAKEPEAVAQSIPTRIVSLLADDAKLLEKARSAGNGLKFIRLYDYGDTSEYADGTNAGHSEADSALCFLLAFWTGRDAGRIDRLFRDSALMRDKWDEVHYQDGRTYGAVTIARAVARSSEVYDPESRSSFVPVTLGRGGALRSALDTSLPPFPIDALPAAFADLATEGAESKGCPVEFYALPLLVTAGAAIGNSYELALKSDFRQGSNLYCAIVGAPGTGKSPALADVTRPLELAQIARHKVYQQALEDYQEALQVRDDRKRGEKGERPVEPVMRDVLTTNATVEALVVMLDRAAVLLYADELSGVLLGMNQYKGGKGSDRQFYLAGWSRSFLANHRKKAGDTTIVDAPHFSVLGGIQPELLKTMEVEGDDGFLDRFLWAMPEAKASKWSTAVVSKSTRDLAQQIIDRLLDGAEQETLVVRPSADAAVLWVSWFDGLSDQMNDEQFPARLIGPWAKLSSQAARIALILHACDDGGAVLSGETMARALRIVDCLAAHTRKVYSVLAVSQRSLEMKILEAIPPQGRVQQSVLSRNVFHRHLTARVLREALDTLKEAGILAEEYEETPGRRALYWRRL